MEHRTCTALEVYAMPLKQRFMLILTSSVELAVAVICGCALTLAPLIRYLFGILTSPNFRYSSKIKKLSSHLGTYNARQEPATKDIKLTLGSQIDGQGFFINPITGPVDDADRARIGYPPHSQPFAGSTHDEPCHKLPETVVYDGRQGDLCKHPGQSLGYSLSPKDSSTHTNIRSSYSEDMESALPENAIRVNTQLESSWSRY